MGVAFCLTGSGWRLVGPDQPCQPPSGALKTVSQPLARPDFDPILAI
jgi:hypothetical protein